MTRRRAAGSVSQMKLTALFAFLLFLVLPAGGCDGRTAPSVKQTAEAMLPVLRTFADVALRLHVTDAFRAKAPALFALLDADADGVLTLEEAFAVPDKLTDTAFVAACVLALERLVNDPNAFAAPPPPK